MIDDKDGRYRENVKQGSIVKIKDLNSSNFFIGYVNKVFSKADYNPDGIKVLIGYKTVGRVKDIYNSELEAMVCYKDEFDINNKKEFINKKLILFQDIWFNSDLNKKNYGDYMYYHPFEVDKEMERIDTADFDLLGALMTLMFREEHMTGDYGMILTRVEQGYFYRILKRVNLLKKDQT